MLAVEVGQKLQFPQQGGEEDDWLLAMRLLEWKKYNLSSGPNEKASVW